MPLDVATLDKIVSSQYIWTIICFYLAYIGMKAVKKYIETINARADKREQELMKLYETEKHESIQREQRLMEHLDRTTDALDRIDSRLALLESKIGEKETVR